MKSRVIWTADMDADLRRMRAEGAGMIRCAERLGIPRKVVARRIAELGLPKLQPRPPRIVWTKDMDDALRAERANRGCYIRCAERVGVSRRLIEQRVKELCLPPLGRNA